MPSYPPAAKSQPITYIPKPPTPNQHHEKSKEWPQRHEMDATMHLQIHVGSQIARAVAEITAGWIWTGLIDPRARHIEHATTNANPRLMASEVWKIWLM